MAYATTTLPASSIDADAPMLLFGQALARSGVAFLGKWSATQDMTATDISLTGFPASRCLDGFWTRATKPTTSATTHYLMFHADSDKPVDAAVLLGHNIKDAPGSGAYNVTLRTADDDVFSSNVAAIATGSGSKTSDGRLVLLAGSNQYTNVERLAVEIIANSAWIPEVAEVFVGQRLQLHHQPLVPYDSQAYAADVRQHRSASGVVSLVKRSSGQRAGQIKFLLGSATERDAIRSYFEESDYGGEPFFLLPNPSTDPQEAYYVEPVASFSAPMTRPPFSYEYVLEVEEMGPYYAAELRQTP